jgi:hypothetical protein
LLRFGSLPHDRVCEEVVVALVIELVRRLTGRRRKTALPPWAEIVRVKAGL